MPDAEPPDGEAGAPVEDPAAIEAREDEEAAGWLAFVRSRAGARADRRAARRERLVVGGVLAAVALVVVVALLWRPWGGGGEPDTGNEALGADRVPVLLQVQNDDGAAFSAILSRDRTGELGDAVVPVPATLSLTVEGSGMATVRSALADAGPTLTREALGELLGLSLVGSWLLTEPDFTALVDRVGGVRVEGKTLDGRAALARAAEGAAGTAAVLDALVGGFPRGFTAAGELLADLGVLDAPGLPVPRLAAVLSGLARERADGGLTVAPLPVDSSGTQLDPRSADAAVREVLGGEPGGGRADATPRISVSIAAGEDVEASDARADVLGAGYEYLAGPAAPAGAPSTVVVRPGTADAEALGADVADLLGLPASAVVVAEGVPFGADVAVTIGRGRLPG